MKHIFLTQDLVSEWTPALWPRLFFSDQYLIVSAFLQIGFFSALVGEYFICLANFLILRICIWIVFCLVGMIYHGQPPVGLFYFQQTCMRWYLQNVVIIFQHGNAAKVTVTTRETLG